MEISARNALKVRLKKMNSETTQTQQELKPQTQDKLIQQAPERLIWQPRRQNRLVLRFNPTAWAKLAYFRDKTDNEVGGFAVTQPDDLLNVQEFVTVKQEVTPISVKFDDIAVADFFETQVDLGRKPEHFARIWLHTHPGDSPEPSGTDEATFARVFGKCQWAVMFILAENNKSYAKINFNVGPTGEILIPSEVDYSQDFGPSNHKLWDEEYLANVIKGTWLNDIDSRISEAAGLKDTSLAGCDRSSNFISELEMMDPVERQMILQELADRPDLWSGEEEFFYG
jgi:proteasome lid subunit RPN8/RPN11